MKDNYLFLKEVKNLVEKTNCELKVCFQYMNRGDRWIQVRGAWLGTGEGHSKNSGPKRLAVNTLVPSYLCVCGFHCLLVCIETWENKCGF